MCGGKCESKRGPTTNTNGFQYLALLANFAPILLVDGNVPSLFLPNLR